MATLIFNLLLCMEVDNYGALKRYGKKNRTQKELELLFVYVIKLINDSKYDNDNNVKFVVIDKNENEWEVSIKKK